VRRISNAEQRPTWCFEAGLNRKEKTLATKTTTMGKAGDIRNRELLSQGCHRAPRGQEQTGVAALPGLGLADINEDAEEPLLEALIQAVLNSNIEALDVAEPVHNHNRSLTRENEIQNKERKKL